MNSLKPVFLHFDGGLDGDKSFFRGIAKPEGGPTQLFEPPRLCTQSPMFFGKFKRFSLFKLLETGFTIQGQKGDV